MYWYVRGSVSGNLTEIKLESYKWLVGTLSLILFEMVAMYDSCFDGGRRPLWKWIHIRDEYGLFIYFYLMNSAS